jgi:hypothetical protein
MTHLSFFSAQIVTWHSCKNKNHVSALLKLNLLLTVISVQPIPLAHNEVPIVLHRVSLVKCKDTIQKIEIEIPKTGIARSLSQFSHLCVCGRFIYSYRSGCLFCCRKICRPILRITTNLGSNSPYNINYQHIFLKNFYPPPPSTSLSPTPCIKNTQKYIK